MKIMSSEWYDRVMRWIRTLQEDLYQPLGEIRFEAARTMEQLSPGQAMSLSYQPVSEGYTWGNEWEYCWFRGRITLSEEARGRRIVMNLKPGGESTLFVNGKSFGTYRSDWITCERQFYEDNTLTFSADGEEEYEILMETYAGHDYPGGPMSECATGPVLPGSGTVSAAEGSRRVLGKCTFGIWNEEAYQLLIDADTLQKLLTVQDETSLRAARISDALEAFTLCVDFEQGPRDRCLSYKKAREILSPALTAGNGSTMPEFYAVGNAHLDLAWLWPMAETSRKTARTFAAQLRLIEEYPDYRFLQSQPAAYEMCRQHYPELFERIREAVKGGQWIAEGAMWVEPDTNMAGGEALIRQLLYGKQYYKEVLGVDSVVLWLPDTFGYSGALPQILKGSGVKYLVTQKIFWSYNEGEPFPYNYFNWEGIDGSGITVFLPTSYLYQTDPQTVSETWKNRSQLRDLDAFLYPFGYGDGGGGPARDHIEYLLREKNLEGMPGIKMESPVTFFERMDEQGGPRNTYTGELYFNAHRGTFTSQALVKWNNRRAETALHNMELWGTLAMIRGIPYDRDAQQRLWKELLLHQFHDILPGSGIRKVYEESNLRVGAVIAEADEISSRYLEKLRADSNRGAVTLFNALPFESTQTTELPVRFAAGAVYRNGEPVHTWKTSDGKVKALVTVPSFGRISLYPSEQKDIETETEPGKEKNSRDQWACVKETEQGLRMENEKLRVLLNEKGEILSLVLKSSDMEYAKAPMNHFRFFKDVPRRFDAWDIDSNYELQEMEGAFDVSTRILQTAPEAVLEVTGRIGNSLYRQIIRLEPGSDQIIFETDVEWDELHRLWKAAFPTCIHTGEGYNEIQFGYIKRPTGRSDAYDKDRYEVCNHRYTALCDGGNGAAVLNDCKYGISMKDGSMELTLLRAAASPEMRTDRGHHHFTYAFTVWEGSFVQSHVVQRGYELNDPVVLCDGESDTYSFARTDRSNIFIETVKPAEDGSGDVILRLYETAGIRTAAELTVDLRGSIWETDLLENKKGDTDVFEGSAALIFHPFEIKTMRIKTAGESEQA